MNNLKEESEREIRKLLQDRERREESSAREWRLKMFGVEEEQKRKLESQSKEMGDYI